MEHEYEKIIIENRTTLPMVELLDHVGAVLKQGKVSGDCYCYVTRFKDGTIVIAEKNKASDRFIIENEERRRG